jgi:hypothetical protein
MATGQIQTAWETNGTAHASGTVRIAGLGQRGIAGELRLMAPGTLNAQIGGLSVKLGVKRVAGVMEVEGLGPRSVSGTMDANGRLSVDLGHIEQLSIGNLSAWGEITRMDDLLAASQDNAPSAAGSRISDLFQGVNRITDAPTLQALEVALADWKTDLASVFGRNRKPR